MQRALADGDQARARHPAPHFGAVPLRPRLRRRRRRLRAGGAGGAVSAQGALRRRAGRPRAPRVHVPCLPRLRAAPRGRCDAPWPFDRDAAVEIGKRARAALLEGPFAARDPFAMGEGGQPQETETKQRLRGLVQRLARARGLRCSRRDDAARIGARGPVVSLRWPVVALSTLLGCSHGGSIATGADAAAAGAGGAGTGDPDGERTDGAGTGGTAAARYAGGVGARRRASLHRRHPATHAFTRATSRSPIRQDWRRRVRCRR